jgi:hypothetical protein
MVWPSTVACACLLSRKLILVLAAINRIAGVIRRLAYQSIILRMRVKNKPKATGVFQVTEGAIINKRSNARVT